MKNLGNFAIVVIAAVFLAYGVVASAQDLTAFQVMDRVRSNWQGDTFHSTVTLDVVQASQSRSYRLEIWSQGEDLGLVRFLEPEADAGSGYLMVGEELWYYAPAAGKAVPLPAMALGDSLFGSGPAIEDLLHGTLSDKYTATSERDGTDYVLTLTPLPDAPVVYGSLIVRVREDFAPVSIVYNDQRGDVLRTARFSEYVTQDGRILPTRIEVEEKNGDRTVERLVDPEFGIAIPAAVFTVEYLEAGH
jgi:hypothetical protein